MFALPPEPVVEATWAEARSLAHRAVDDRTVRAAMLAP
jgi:hypothetical protein